MADEQGREEERAEREREEARIEREREEARAERDREEERRDREYERREGNYARGGFDWVPFLLGFLLGVVALGVIWFFTQYNRDRQETPPTQIIFENDNWDAGDTSELSDEQMRRIGSSGDVNIYVRREQSPPYSVIYIKQDDNVYRAYDRSDQSGGNGGTPQPTPEEQARAIAEKLPARVSIGRYTWTRGDIVTAQAAGRLETYDDIRLNDRRVYRPAGQSDPAQVYIDVGSDMYVRYTRMSR